MNFLKVDLINSTEIEKRPAFLNYLSDGSLLVSTYEQDSGDETHRNGTFQMFSRKNSKELTTFPVSAGVFRFKVYQDQILAALTNGQLLLMDYNENQLQHEIYSNKISNGMLLCAKIDVETSQILCSDNFGRLFVIDKDFEEVKKQWKAHSLEYSMVDFCFYIM